MKTIDIINSTLASQPEGEELLNMIKVSMEKVSGQYHNCDLLRRVVTVKFDINKLNSDGYTLREILDACPTDGMMADESHKFILIKLQEFIKAREAQKTGGTPPQNNNTNENG